MTTDNGRHRSRRTLLWRAQLASWLAMVALGWYGFHTAALAREAAADRGDEHRQVTANVVCGIGTLITDIVTPPVGDKLKPRQRVMLHRILERLARFEREQLDTLGKSCLPREKP